MGEDVAALVLDQDSSIPKRSMVFRNDDAVLNHFRWYEEDIRNGPSFNASKYVSLRNV